MKHIFKNNPCNEKNIDMNQTSNFRSKIMKRKQFYSLPLMQSRWRMIGTNHEGYPIRNLLNDGCLCV